MFLVAEVLTSKLEVLKPNFDGYEIEYRLLSMEDMEEVMSGIVHSVV